MTHREWLINKAIRIWRRGLPIGADLFALLLSEGVDVDALERETKQLMEEE
jgi:hypothetical protein